MPVLMGLELNYIYGRIAATVQSLCQTGRKREKLAKKREITENALVGIDSDTNRVKRYRPSRTLR